MKRIMLISMAVVLSAPAGAAFAGSSVPRAALAVDSETTSPGGGAGVQAQPRSHLAGFVCHQALEPADRLVSVRAVMRPVTGTQRMQMRFELLSKSSTANAFVALHDGGLGSWIAPADPTLGQRPGDVWIVSHPVSDLPAPAVYRYRVSFRWIGAGGHILSTRTRQTAKCFEPELRPDLLVSSIAVQPIPDKPAKDQYVAAVENKGLSAAGPFAVTFPPGAASAGAAVTITKTVQRLDAGATRDITFVGPACTALSAPAVVVDPDHTVDEYDYADNSLTVAGTCPALTSAPVLAP